MIKFFQKAHALTLFTVGFFFVQGFISLNAMENPEIERNVGSFVKRVQQKARELKLLEEITYSSRDENHDDLIRSALGVSILDKKSEEYMRLNILFKREASRLTAEKEAQDEKKDETSEEYARVLDYHRTMSALFKEQRSNLLKNYEMLAQMDAMLSKAKAAQDPALSSWLAQLDSYITKRKMKYSYLERKREELVSAQMEFDLSFTYEFEAYPFTMKHLDLNPYLMSDTRTISKKLYTIKNAFLRKLEELQNEILELDQEVPFPLLLTFQQYIGSFEAARK